MSYTGIIHRQDVDTGVTIRAKAITPNKMKAAVKDYKITVRKNPEDIYKIAMATNASAKQALDNLIAEGDPEDQGELDFTALLDSETTTITIENDASKNGTDLALCYNSDGSFKERPKIGEAAAYGWIVITTTVTSAETGASASVSSKIYVIVQPNPPEALFSTFTQKYWWDNELRGDNSEIFLGDLPEIVGDLNIRKNDVGGYSAGTARWDISSATRKAKKPNEALFPMLGPSARVIVETQVADLVAGTTKLWGNDVTTRVNPQTGALQGERPTFNAVASYLIDSPVEMRPYFTKKREIGDNTVQAWYTCSGLKVTCTLYLTVAGQGGTYEKDTAPGHYKTIEFDLVTKCKYLTNQEAVAKIAADPNFKMSFLADSFDGQEAYAFTYRADTEANASNVEVSEDLYIKTVANHYAKQIGSANASETSDYLYIYENVPVMFSISQVSSYGSDGITSLGSELSTALFSKSDPSDICPLLPETDDNLFKYRGVKLNSAAAENNQIVVLKALLNVNAYADNADPTVYTSAASNQVPYFVKVKFLKQGA